MKVAQFLLRLRVFDQVDTVDAVDAVDAGDADDAVDTRKGL